MAFWLYLGLAILLTPPITIGLLAASLCPLFLQTLLWNKDAPVPQKAKQESMWWNWWPKGP
jgi:hypothetical protein